MSKDLSPIVSVVVPVYNAEKYLPEALLDLQKQTLKNVEFIFVDDGSTDSSLAILQTAAKKDFRIRILQQNHKFAGSARNLGLEAARGKWFIALDADDRFESNLLERTVKRGEKTDAQIVLFDADVLKEGKKYYQNNLAYANQLPKEPFKPSSETFAAFGVTATWTKLYRMDFLRNGGFLYQETFESNDIRFTIHTMASAKCVVAIPKILVHYRIGLKDNIQSNKDAYSTDVIRAYSSLHELLVKDGLWDEFRKIYITRAFISLLFGRMFTFKNVGIAHDWFNQLKDFFLKKLALDNITKDDIVGPYSSKIWERYQSFVSLSFEEWLWLNLKETQLNTDAIKESITYRIGVFVVKTLFLFKRMIMPNIYRK